MLVCHLFDQSVQQQIRLRVPFLCFALADKCCVGQERAHLAEGQRQAAVQKIQGETKMLLESCSRNNVSVLTILQASASEFQTVTKELLESMDDTNTDVVEEMLETIEACVAEVQAQREQLVTGAHELAESLHGVVAGEASTNADGSPRKSKLELRVEELSEMLEQRSERALAVELSSRNAQEAMAAGKQRLYVAERRLESVEAARAEQRAAQEAADATVLAEQERKRQLTFKVGAVLQAAAQPPSEAELGAGQPVEAAEGEPFDLSLLRSRAFHGFGLALEPATTAAVVAAGRAATGPAAAMERQVAEDIVKLLEQGYSPVVPSGAAKREKKISPALRALRAELAQEEAEVAALEKDKREMARAVDGASSLTASRGSTPATPAA